MEFAEVGEEDNGGKKEQEGVGSEDSVGDITGFNVGFPERKGKMERDM